jgi:hypothetical protein
MYLRCLPPSPTASDPTLLHSPPCFLVRPRLLTHLSARPLPVPFGVHAIDAWLASRVVSTIRSVA